MSLTVYRASAGAGKTYTLALQYIKLLLTGWDVRTAHRSILAVTFTNDATAEMKERILLFLSDMAKGRDFRGIDKELSKFSQEEIKENADAALHGILHDYGRFNIMTIDGFFQQVLRFLAKELGVGTRLNIELDTEIPVYDAVKTLIAESSQDKNLLSQIENYLEDKLENSKWDVEKELRSFGHKLFNEKFQERESALDKQLKESPQKINDTINLCKEIIAANPENEVAINSAEFILKYIHQLELIDRIADQVQLQNADKGRFMLAQTQQLLSELLQEGDASFVFEKIGSTIRHVLIDEFQDTSFLQWKNFKSLLAELDAAGGHNLIVGDVKQSIYRWRNSDWSILNDMPTGTVLGTNYRSKKEVVEFNNSVFAAMGEILAKEYESELGVTLKRSDMESENPFRKAYNKELVEQQAQQGVGGSVDVSFITLPPRKQSIKFEYIQEEILEALHKYDSKGDNDTCILCRTNAQVREVAENLIAYGYTNIISEDAFQFKSSKDLQLIIAVLRLVNNPQNRLYMADVHALRDNNIPQSLQGIELPKNAERIPLYDLVNEICRTFNIATSAYLYAFLDNLIDYSRKEISDIRNFLEYWEDKMQNMSISTPQNTSGIRIMTIHKSKGMEFDTVIIPFCQGDMAKKHGDLIWCSPSSDAAPPFDLAVMPVPYSEKMKQSIFSKEYNKETEMLWMDNLNTWYVAFTRAKKNLIVFCKEPSKTGKSLTIEKMLKEVI
ncbi:MAG: UvrD-helicase domain-containing protein [Bacteroidales bacterium]|jgi:ATP-dependent exoDNAse (exonuclease V) beta subunit|nr:UvrD-helicase domain-containing protein [Bacteroidales bacterium]